MLIGIAGPSGAGKRTFAEWLKNEKQFCIIRLTDTFTTTVRAGEDKENRLLVQSEKPRGDELAMTTRQLSEFILDEQRWRDNYCVYPIDSFDQLDQLRRRPFFWLVAIDGPALTRYGRISAHSDIGLEAFLEQDCNHHKADEFNKDQRFLPLRHADMVMMNPYDTLTAFHHHLNKWFANHLLPKQTSSFLRPSWDDYFMLLADLAAYRSNCMKRRVGCILVKHHRVLATGYNGTPRGTLNCCEGGCKRCNDGAKCGQNLSECLCMHAEENALLEAGRERIGADGEGVVLYCNTCPCLSCAKKIVQCGVKEVVYKQKYGMDDVTKGLFEQVGVGMRQYIPSFRLHICSDAVGGNDETMDAVLFNTDHPQ